MYLHLILRNYAFSNEIKTMNTMKENILPKYKSESSRLDRMLRHGYYELQI